jgi:hypothetical protein
MWNGWDTLLCIGSGWDTLPCIGSASLSSFSFGIAGCGLTTQVGLFSFKPLTTTTTTTTNKKQETRKLSKKWRVESSQDLVDERA